MRGRSPQFWTAAALVALLAIAWLIVIADWLWFRQLDGTTGNVTKWVVFASAAALAAAAAILAGLQWKGQQWKGWQRNAVWTVAFVPLWQFSVFAADAFIFDSLRVWLAQAGLFTLFAIGLFWTVWALEIAAVYYARLRYEARPAPDAMVAAYSSGHAAAAPGNIWNPLDLDAWYYGGQSGRLRQSTAGLCTYTLLFVLVVFLSSQVGGCQEVFELPAGGGEQQQMTQQVKIQKVIKKKYVINPASVVVFNPPPIDDVDTQLLEVTKHQYKVGYGDGDGAGYAGGTARGKIRFVRLEYAGGDWNQDFGIGADLNMLIEYGARTSQPVAERTESRTVGQLANITGLPLVYLTGQGNISLSKSEIGILRDYLITKHGMLFGDNGGSSHFHNQFFAMMRQTLPHVEPVRIPYDDLIHSVPFKIDSLPYVAPHGGRDAWGWKVDGRWVCYYHPGDIGDAWTDDHAGVPADIWQNCYNLGVNVINYANVEYSKWLQAQSKKK